MSSETQPVPSPASPSLPSKPKSWVMVGGVVVAMGVAGAYMALKPNSKEAGPGSVSASASVSPSWKLPSTMTAAPGTATAPAPHTTNVGDIGSMAERLAARLKTQPDDAQGWAILARSYDVMGNLPDALMAYKRASALLPDDQVLMADYAKAVAKANQGGGVPSTPDATGAKRAVSAPQTSIKP